MLLATQTEVLFRRLGVEKALDIFAEAGYDALDYSAFNMKNDPDDPVLQDTYADYAAYLRGEAEKRGLIFTQSHAPFPSYHLTDPEYNETIMNKLTRSITFAGLLGAKQICVHPVTFRNEPKKTFDFNVQMYRALEPAAENAGIKIALENMFWRDENNKAIRPGACGVPDDFIALYDALDDGNFTCLFDVGHAGLVGEPADGFIRKLGHDRLGALHVHDNNFKDDNHTLPFTRKLDWNAITSALRDVDYKGEFTYEADNFLKPIPDDLLPDAVKFMTTVGRKLINMIEEGTEE